MRYSLHVKELNNWKARVTERLAQCYVDEVLIPALRKEGWDIVFYTSSWIQPQFDDERQDLRHLLIDPRRERGTFMRRGVSPTSGFISKFKELTGLLENAPDGFLFKLKKTGEFRSVDGERLPIVDGEVEVVEVKCGKGRIAPNQKRSYAKILKNGFLLHLFHIHIISFEKNQFQLKEKLLSGIDDLVGL